MRDLRAWRIQKASSDFERGLQDWSLMHHQPGFVDLFNTLNWIPFHRDPEEDVRWRRITPCEDYISLLFIVLIVVLLFIQNNSYFKTCLPRPKLGPRLHLSVPHLIPDDKGMVTQSRSYSSNSSCNLLSCIFLLLIFLKAEVRLFQLPARSS